MFSPVILTAVALALTAATTSAYSIPGGAFMSHATQASSISAAAQRSDVAECAESIKWVDLKGFEPTKGSWFRLSYSPSACSGMTTAFNAIVGEDGNEVACDQIRFIHGGHALGTCGDAKAGVPNGNYYQTFVVIDPEFEDLGDSEPVSSHSFTISHAATFHAGASHNIAARSQHGHSGGHGGGHGSGHGSAPSQVPQPSSSSHHKKRQTGEQMLLGVFGTGEGSCASGLTACQVFGRSDVFECLDLRTDIENCGVCPNAFLGSNDCTSIEMVGDVSCRAGVCQVETCEKGWAPSANSTVCVPA